MNKYQRALAKLRQCESYCGLETGNIAYLDNKYSKTLEELVNKATAVKAVSTFYVNQIFDPDTMACIDAYETTDYWCPVCNNWLTNDSAYDEEDINMICNNCGQVIKGVEKDE